MKENNVFFLSQLEFTTKSGPTLLEKLLKFMYICILNLICLYIICETIHLYIRFNIY